MTGVERGAVNLNGHIRTMQAQISFDRPDVSPCLDIVRGDKAKYDRVLEILRLGGERLKETPRGDIEEELVLCKRHEVQIRRYINRMEGEEQNSCNIETATKRFDAK